MSTAALTGLTALISLAALAWLAATDPKRLRSRGLRRRPAGTVAARSRPLAIWTAVLPGLLLALSADWPALLLWLGTVMIGGWLIAQRLPADRRAG